MPTYFTASGDDGTTGLLGPGRVSKYDLRMEALGALDEASAALGMARSQSASALVNESVKEIQRQLYQLMAETAATPENAEKFRVIRHAQVSELEEKIQRLGSQVDMPQEFILPGDTPAAAALDLARAVARRAERRVAELLALGEISNPELLRYLNRLSSYLFVLELYEIQLGGLDHPTIAKANF